MAMFSCKRKDDKESIIFKAASNEKKNSNSPLNGGCVSNLMPAPVNK
jgi:hypothetical protein